MCSKSSCMRIVRKRAVRHFETARLLGHASVRVFGTRLARAHPFPATRVALRARSRPRYFPLMCGDQLLKPAQMFGIAKHAVSFCRRELTGQDIGGKLGV